MSKLGLVVGGVLVATFSAAAALTGIEFINPGLQELFSVPQAFVQSFTGDLAGTTAGALAGVLGLMGTITGIAIAGVGVSAPAPVRS